MALVYLKISKISGLKINKSARYEVSATLSSDLSTSTPVLFQIDNSSSPYLSSENVWMLPLESNSHEDSISVTLFKGKKKYKKVAKLVLPLKWFPTDAVVHESFPMYHMEENERKKRSIFADVSIHLSTRGADPFRAPPGKMNVKPMWVTRDEMQARQAVVGYIPNSGQQMFACSHFARVAPPIGIPRILAGPAQQVFSQPLMQPPNYTGYTGQQMQQIQQQQLPQMQQAQQMQQQQMQQQQQTQQIQRQQNPFFSQAGGSNVNPNENPKLEIQPEDLITLQPVTNEVTHSSNQNA